MTGNISVSKNVDLANKFITGAFFQSGFPVSFALYHKLCSSIFYIQYYLNNNFFFIILQNKL